MRKKVHEEKGKKEKEGLGLLLIGESASICALPGFSLIMSSKVTLLLGDELQSRTGDGCFVRNLRVRLQGRMLLLRQ